MKEFIFSLSGACFICLSGVFFHNPQHVYVPTPIQTKELEPDSVEIRLLFAGDVMGHEPQFLAALQADKSYEYRDNFRFVKEYVSSVDLAIANLEVTLAGPPYSGYPMFSSPDALAFAVKDAGFDVLQTANNHSCDKGLKGIKRTIDVLDSLHIPHVGTYRNQSEYDSLYPLVLDVHGIKIGLLNYTYGTNGMPIPAGTIVNTIDTAAIRNDLSKAKKRGADFIVATYHWGIEYQRNESAEQRFLAEFSAKHGADLVIGGHPHVVQPIKKVMGQTDSIWTVYSLGNYISNQRAQYKNGGIMVEVKLIKDKQNTRLKSIGYIPVWVYKASGPKASYTLIPGFMDSIVLKTDSILKMSSTDKALMSQFFKDTRKHLDGINELN